MSSLEHVCFKQVSFYIFRFILRNAPVNGVIEVDKMIRVKCGNLGKMGKIEDYF